MKRIISKNTSDVIIKDSEGNIVKTYYGPDEGKKILYTFYWANDLQGRLKQELYPPRPYHNRIPIPYVKEDIERTPSGTLISHFKYYHGVRSNGTPILKAYVEREQPEAIRNIDGYLNDEDLRFQVKKFVHDLINNGAWEQYKIENTEMRKSKKSKPVIKKRQKPVIKKKKVVLKKKSKPSPKKRK